ncbi:hypothetical protein [Rudanella lutea]|uniref:hypothetical protein n=1 Tax=Rudanella lutea TaxID=451374 RepID=UPI00036D640D|nr:hypothetical protein [Rudanella lutea]
MRTWLRSILFVEMWLALTSLVWAQSVRRIELAAPTGSESIITLPLGDKGVLLLTRTDRVGYQLTKYSTDLDRDWSLTGQLPDNLEYVASTFDGRGAVYLLFSSYRLPFCQVVRVSIGPGFSERFNLNVVERLQVTHFKTLGDGIFMAGIVDEHPVLYHSHLSSRQARLLPGGERGSAIQSLEADTAHGRMTVSYTVRRGRDLKLIANVYDELGQTTTRAVIEPKPDYALLSGRLSVLDDSTQLVVGNYGYRAMQSNGVAGSQGLYISRVGEGQTPQISYISFTDFKNFFRYLGDREQERMERRAQRRKEAGSDLRLNYRLLMHELVRHRGQYVLVAEVFYPQFRYQNSYPYGINSWYGWRYSPLSYYSLYNPYMWNPWNGPRGLSPQQVFDGYVYTHAVVAGFDAEGKLLWDNCLELTSERSIDLQEKVRLVQQGDQLALYHNHKGRILQTVIRPNGMAEEKPQIDIAAVVDEQRDQSLVTDDVRFWHDRYFLAWGYQRGEGRKRVFYLDKIAF